MTQRPHVPKFGNWENDDNVPYTVYFDKARMNKGAGKIMNPNDPQENPELFDSIASQSHTSPSREKPIPGEPIGQVAAKNAHEPRTSRGSADSTPQHYGGRGSNPARPARQSTGSEQSFERSPLHPHYQGRIVGKGSGSPARDGKNSFEGHGTPGRSRLKPASRGDESPDRGAAVPRFGEWDEKDPSSADNYTHIFNKVREERQTGTANTASIQNRPSNANSLKNNESKICCFPWCRK